MSKQDFEAKNGIKNSVLEPVAKNAEFHIPLKKLSFTSHSRCL